MAKTKQSGITIADLISCIGFLLFALLIGFGLHYQTGGAKPGSCILLAALLAAFTFAILRFMIHAKQAKDSMKWRIAQWTGLGVYILLAIASAGIAMHFPAISANKQPLQAAGKEDVQNLRNLITTYQENMSDDLLSTKTAVEFAFQRGIGESLRTWLTERGINNATTLNEWHGDRGETYLDQDAAIAAFNDRLDGFEASIDAWSWLGVPRTANQLQQCANDIADHLNGTYHDAALPRIEQQNGAGKYDIVGYYNDIRAYNTPTIRFQNEIVSFSGFSWGALLWCVLAHLLILFVFIVTPGARTVRNRGHLIDDGGIVLDY